ncbi:MAG: hypothetical protein IJ269_06580 [Bacteroidales bacterium]|nr:hypothetical protein [Bacteroidales bacterium]
MKHINYKRRKNIVATLLLCIIWLLPTVAWCQTKLYKQYKHRTDLVAMCIMNYPITDSVKVDVTMLVPNNKEAVYYLVEEFNLGIEKDIIDKDLGDEYSGLFMCNVCRDNVKKEFGPIINNDYTNVSELVYNCSKGTIVVFHNIDTEERDDVVGTFLINTLAEPEIFPSIDNANNKK